MLLKLPLLWWLPLLLQWWRLLLLRWRLPLLLQWRLPLLLRWRLPLLLQRGWQRCCTASSTCSCCGCTTAAAAPCPRQYPDPGCPRSHNPWLTHQYAQQASAPLGSPDKGTPDKKSRFGLAQCSWLPVL
jgi:hypothetical protein